VQGGDAPGLESARKLHDRYEEDRVERGPIGAGASPDLEPSAVRERPGEREVIVGVVWRVVNPGHPERQPDEDRQQERRQQERPASAWSKFLDRGRPGRAKAGETPALPL
jgi:hypothetical protein